MSAIGIVAVLFLVYFLAFSPFSPFGGTSTPTANASTFQLISAVDGEDVSDFVEISVWVPDSDAEFDETEDIYTWSNFEEEESSKDAEDVSIDLSSYEYVWVEIDPDAESAFQNNHYLITPAGRNAAYKYYVYDPSSDVNVGFVNSTGGRTWGNFTLPTVAPASQVPYGHMWVFLGTTFSTGVIADNLTMTLNVPYYTHAGTHVGSNWDIEQSEYDDMSTAEMEFVHNEANWQSQAPLYVPANDLEKTGEDGLESITNAFCVRWTYNTTVSTTDSAATQVNMTISDNTPAEIVIDGTFIYMIFYDAIDFEAGPYTVAFEYEEAKSIYATAVQTGRLAVPRGSQALGAFTAYSNVGT